MGAAGDKACEERWWEESCQGGDAGGIDADAVALGAGDGLELSCLCQYSKRSSGLSWMGSGSGGPYRGVAFEEAERDGGAEEALSESEAGNACAGYEDWEHGRLCHCMGIVGKWSRRGS